MKKLMCACGLIIVLTPALAQAWLVSVGWTQSDVGLQNKGEGFYVGVGQEIPLASDLFDASFSFDYVQKKGSQLTQFADPVEGFFTEDASVTLHVLQPSVSCGISPRDILLQPRLYAGAAIGLKVKESWSDFPGQTNQEYGYKDTDISAHLGFSLNLGRIIVDTRWTKSLVGQLLFDNQEIPLFLPDKADDPLAGVKQPEEGFKTETWQVGIGVPF